MTQRALEFSPLKRLLAAAGLVFAVVTCGGDDDDGMKGPTAGSSGSGNAGAGQAGSRNSGGNAGSGRGGTGNGGSTQGGASGSSGDGASGDAGQANAGGADGQGGAGGAPSTLSGVVAGYLQGARVFLDLDGDFVRDADEPSATSRADGSFELALDGNVDAAAFPVVAVVPEDAIDSQTGNQVLGAYVMAAPAGANAS